MNSFRYVTQIVFNQSHKSTERPTVTVHWLVLMLNVKTDLYSAIKSEDSEALDSGTSQLGSQRGFGGIEMF